MRRLSTSVLLLLVVVVVRNWSVTVTSSGERRTFANLHALIAFLGSSYINNAMFRAVREMRGTIAQLLRQPAVSLRLLRAVMPTLSVELHHDECVESRQNQRQDCSVTLVSFSFFLPMDYGLVYFWAILVQFNVNESAVLYQNREKG